MTSASRGRTCGSAPSRRRRWRGPRRGMWVPAGPGAAARPRSHARAGARRRRAGGRGRGSQGASELGIRGNRRAGDRPCLVRRDGQADPLAGVLGTHDDHQPGDLQAVQHRGRELAREGKTRVRNHRRRPLLGLPLAGAEQAIDHLVELGRLGGIEPTGHGWRPDGRPGHGPGGRPDDDLRLRRLCCQAKQRRGFGMEHLRPPCGPSPRGRRPGGAGRRARHSGPGRARSGRAAPG